MTPHELRAHLDVLRLNQVEAAQLLGTNARTVRRWLQEDAAPVPGPAASALRAWARLHRAGLAWRPDEVALVGTFEGGDADALARRRAQALEVDSVVARVRARGGPAAPWDVDLERSRATLGGLRLTFYRLQRGGFAPQSYRRRDGEANPTRDAPLLEDGFACIARALERAGQAASPPLTFAAPTVVGERIVLWDDRPPPRVVLNASLAVLRAVLGLPCSTNDGAEFVDRHRTELARWAERRLSEPATSVNAWGVRELLADEPTLRALHESIEMKISNGAQARGEGQGAGRSVGTRWP